MNILVIAPHPDDEVLGCGATIAKHVEQGDDVVVAFVTKGYEPDWSREYLDDRISEIKKSNKVLGIKKSYSLGFPAVKLDTIPQKTLNDSLSKVVSKVNPEIIYIPHRGDVNMDHKLVHDACLVATRPFARESIKKVLAYETVSETEWGSINSPFVPNVYEDVSSFLNKKLKALQAYKSEVKEFPHPRSNEVLSALTVKRGSEVGVKAAEAFMLIREIK